MKKLFISFYFILASFGQTLANEYNLYLEADQTVLKYAGISIKKSLETSLEFYKLKNPNSKLKLNLISLDHRGNTRRSLMNFQRIQKDPKAIAVFAGLHSPPLITNNSYINDNKILTFVSWAAGGPITRFGGENNWFFRLSLDDTQVGGYIAKYSIKEQKCTKPYLLLESTPWGRSNEKSVTEGLNKYGGDPYQIQYFNWGVSRPSSLKIANRIKNSKANCIFFVGNSNDARNLFRSLKEEKVTLPVLSHWGITGGDNREMAKLIKDNKIDLKVVQTKFSFLNKKMNSYQKEVMNYILKKNGFKNRNEIEPMSGWVHTFDLSQIFLKALDSVDKSGSVVEVRKRLKSYLESKSLNTNGLIKKYTRVFSKPIGEKSYAHEGLSSRDYTMRRFQSDGSLK